MSSPDLKRLVQVELLLNFFMGSGGHRPNYAMQSTEQKAMQQSRMLQMNAKPHAGLYRLNKSLEKSASKNEKSTGIYVHPEYALSVPNADL